MVNANSIREALNQVNNFHFKIKMFMSKFLSCTYTLLNVISNFVPHKKMLR